MSTPLGEVLLAVTPRLVYELLVDYLGHVGKVLQHELGMEPDEVPNNVNGWDLETVYTSIMVNGT